MTEKHYHHGDLRVALVGAARTILEREGLVALTLRACARAAGVSHAAPLHHFRSLAELQSAVAASGFDDFVGFLNEVSASAATPTLRLIAMGHAYVDFSKRHPALYRLMFGVEGPHVKSPVLETALIAAWNQLHVGVVAAFGAERSSENAMFIWSVVHGHAMLVQSGSVPPAVDIDRQLNASLELVSRGLDKSSVLV